MIRNEKAFPSEFRALRHEIYGDDPNVFPVSENVPAIEHCHFVLDDGSAKARLTAFVDPRFPGMGGIGFFEAHADVEIGELFSAAEQWLREKGCHEVVGPLDFSIWQRYRLMTHGQEHATFLGEPYNPQYYVDYFEQAGYRPIRTWASMLGIWEDRKKALWLLRPFYWGAIARGYRFVSSSKETLERDLETIYPMLATSFQGFWGYVPLEAATYWETVEAMRPCIDPETILLVYDPDNVPVAFQITLKDARQDLPRARYIQQFVGRIPDGRKTRVPLGKAVLYATVNIFNRRNTPVDIVAALMSEGNHSRAMAKNLTAPFKEYALFGKPLSPN